MRLRDVLYETPWLYKIARTIRFTAIIGPWRVLLVRYHRRFNRNPKVPTLDPTLVPDVDASTIASTLERAGFAMCGVLPEDYVSRVVALCGPIKRGTIYNPHEKWDVVRQAAYDSTFIDIARRYLGVEPIICASKIWWSLPDVKGEESLFTKEEMGARFEKEHTATFHFDVADCKSLVVFIYLTDVVDGECGPHMVIEGTHKKKALSELVRVYLDDDSALRRFGADNIKTVFGTKGTFFFEELTAYHKGIVAKKPRLIMCINYTLHRQPVKTLD
jgi:hypothetical protein